MRKLPMIASMVAILAVGFVGIAAAQAPTTQSEEPANCGLCRHNLSTNEHWFNGSCSGAGSDCRRGDGAMADTYQRMDWVH